MSQNEFMITKIPPCTLRNKKDVYIELFTTVLLMNKYPNVKEYKLYMFYIFFLNKQNFENILKKAKTLT